MTKKKLNKKIILLLKPIETTTQLQIPFCYKCISQKDISYGRIVPINSLLKKRKEELLEKVLNETKAF